jgi:putative transposase
VRSHGVRRYTAKTFVHLVWATWQRLPIITPSRRRMIHRAVASQAHKLGCTILALGGTEDHVHLFVWFPPSIAISDLVSRAKGASAHLVNASCTDSERFQWQQGYGAFTVGPNQVEAVVRYVKRQQQRHATGRLSEALEKAGD